MYTRTTVYIVAN